MQRGQAQILQGAEQHVKRGLRSSAGSNHIYPPVVIAFTHSQEQLIHDWVEVGRIPPLDSAKGREKIDHLTSLPGQKIKQVDQRPR